MDINEVKEIREDLYSGYRLDEQGNAINLTDHDYFLAAKAIDFLLHRHEGLCPEHKNNPDDPGYNDPSKECVKCWKNRALRAEEKASDLYRQALEKDKL